MNRFIIADAEKCIGCRTCEVACVVSHQDTRIAQPLLPWRSPRIRVVKAGHLLRRWRVTSAKMRPAPTSARPRQFA
jgi:Fe-S-cluster-containing hydrogenase component 2